MSRQEIRDLRREFDPLVFESFEDSVREVGAPRARGAELARDYLEVVGRLGVE